MCYIGTEEVDEPGVCVMRNSGDLVQRDSDGRIWYLGRTDDQIKRHGKRVNLKQVEQVLIVTITKQHSYMHCTCSD